MRNQLPKADSNKFTPALWVWNGIEVAVLGPWDHGKKRKSQWLVSPIGCNDLKDFFIADLDDIDITPGRFAQQLRNGTWQEVEVPE